MITSEAGILHQWNKDIYFILGDQKDNEWFVKVLINPFVSYMAWSDNNGVFRFNSSYTKMNKIIILTPLSILLIICVFSLIYLLSGKDPNKPPSALLNKNVPIFESSSLYNSKKIIKTINIKNKKTLINFFASWCSPCKNRASSFF